MNTKCFASTVILSLIPPGFSFGDIGGPGGMGPTGFKPVHLSHEQAVQTGGSNNYGFSTNGGDDYPAGEAALSINSSGADSAMGPAGTDVWGNPVRVRTAPLAATRTDERNDVSAVTH